ncbi:hypothetical protein BKA82DRAFT_3144683 [Pisolithus tinctorius]|nr:hypothetical protein BKA82DRAFT_3144683 [Pisolithus tinctorius]
MRIADGFPGATCRLLVAYWRNGIGRKPYFWYTDMSKHGTCPHSGYLKVGSYSILSQVVCTYGFW